MRGTGVPQTTQMTSRNYRPISALTLSHGAGKTWLLYTDKTTRLKEEVIMPNVTMHPNLDNPAHPIPSQAHSESYPNFTKGNPATHLTPSYFWEQTLSNTTMGLRRARLPGYPAHASSPLAGVIVTKQERRHCKESRLLLFTTEDKTNECWCLVQLINMHSLWHLPCTCGCPPSTCTCGSPLLTCTCWSPLC